MRTNSGNISDNSFLFNVDVQASADVRVRVRETVIRVRIRKTALRTVIRVTPDVQQLHDMLPFSPFPR